MKFVGAQLSYFLRDPSLRRNLRALAKYVAFVAAVIAVFAVLFHFIMLYEGRYHSWITGLYWTLTVMSTLGFGDITFESDLGRLFSIVVLVSGIILLLIVLPFAFIRFFYAPWLEAQLRRRAPRAVPRDTKGHVVICANDAIAPSLIRRLEGEDIPVFVLEDDAAQAANWYLDGLPVIAGELDDQATYEAVGVGHARLVLVNRADTVNTSIVLAIRAVDERTPIVALAAKQDSVDVLELTGATQVLPLMADLGEQLAGRVIAPPSNLCQIGRYLDLVIAELPVRRTSLAGQTVVETGLRRDTGVSIVASRERGELHPVRGDTRLVDDSTAVVVGTSEQLDALDARLGAADRHQNPTVVIGGGRVGASAVRALCERGIAVHLVEEQPELGDRLTAYVDKVFVGDAADYHLLQAAGIHGAPSVIVTTGDDAMNIYLASYCRKLNPDVRILSRITRERNIDAIHRAGADFVLSYATLGTEEVMSIIDRKELVVLGEHVSLFAVAVPPSLVGATLARTGIGARTGLTVIALRRDGAVTTQLTPDTTLTAGTELLMLGAVAQREEFDAVFVD